MHRGPEDDERPGARRTGRQTAFQRARRRGLRCQRFGLTVTCAGCPYGTFGRLLRGSIQRSSVVQLYTTDNLVLTSWNIQLCIDELEQTTSRTEAATLPLEGTPPLARSAGRSYAAGAPSSSKKPRVLLGSTGMPGPIVVVNVIFLR